MSFGVCPVRLDVGDPAEPKEQKMQYLLMIYQNEAEYAKNDADQEELRKCSICC